MTRGPRDEHFLNYSSTFGFREENKNATSKAVCVTVCSQPEPAGDRGQMVNGWNNLTPNPVWGREKNNGRGQRNL